MIRGDFHGSGGWEIALNRLGLESVGVEWSEHPVATARAAGHTVIQGDVRTVDVDASDGYTASPSCQTWSPAGKGTGRAALPHVLEALDLVADGTDPHKAVQMVRDEGLDERTELVLHPLTVIRDQRPLWVALEQVTPVLPVWRAYARHMADWGYSVDTAVVSAEQHGVPQTRKRAILVAHRERHVHLPVPTHTKYRKGAPRQAGGLLPWVSMADALGAGYEGLAVRSNYGTGGDPRNRGVRTTAEPAPTVTSKVDRNKWVPRAAVPGDTSWVYDRPSPTIVGTFAPDVIASPGWRKAGDGPRQTQPGSVRVTVQEAAVLQTFDRDYPWQGPKGAQHLAVGNAIPPLLAEAILKEVV